MEEDEEENEKDGTSNNTNVITGTAVVTDVDAKGNTPGKLLF